MEQRIPDTDEFKLPPTLGQRAAHGLRAVLRHRAVRGMFVVGSVLILMLGLSSWRLWTKAVSESCREVPRTDLTLGQMGDIKRRIEAYKAGQSDHLLLDAGEATFVFAEALRFPVWIEIEQDRLKADVAIEEDSGRCYNIRFDGVLAITEGVARVTPDALSVGDLDLTSVMGGQEFDLHPEDIQSERVRRLLTHTVEMTVVDHRIRLVVDDIASLQ